MPKLVTSIVTCDFNDPRVHDMIAVYLYRAIDQFGQAIDVLVSEKRDIAATRRFFTRALESSTGRPRPRSPPTAPLPAGA